MTLRNGPEPAGSEPAHNGAPGPAQARIRPYLKTPRLASARSADPDPDPGSGSGPGPGPGSAESGERPRPFVLTSGRVHGADPGINLETQVSARPAPPPGAAPVAALPPELQAIIAMCAEPVSIAEISARVPLHLGVTKVLVGDLRANGYLDVHTMDVVNPHDPETILRVIRGLRAIA